MLSLKDLGGILLIAILWSPSFLFIKIGLCCYSPVMITLFRCLAGGLFLLAYLCFKKVGFRNYLPYWKRLLVSSILSMAIPFSLCAWGEIYVDSGTAGIVEGTVPIFVLLFSVWFLKDHAVHWYQSVGIGIGFVGILVLFVPSLHFGGKDNTIGLILVLAMSICFAGSYIYSFSKLKGLPPLLSTGVQLFFAFCVMIIPAFILEYPFHHVCYHGKTLFILVLLGVFCSALGWVVYYEMIKRTHVSYVAISSLLMPVFSVILGIIFLGEAFTWYKCLGTIITLLSMIVSGKMWPHLLEVMGVRKQIK